MDSHIKDINRLRALLDYAVIDTPSELFYDTLNSLVSTICNTPISLISFIDDKRQWHKAKIGIDPAELPVEDTICQYTLLEDDILEIPDTLEDDRLVNNPLVQVENGIRFYAGISLRSKNGYAIGSVCAADYKPHHLDENQKQALRDVSRMVMMHLDTKKRNQEMEQELRAVLNEKIRASERQVELQERIYNNLLEAISQSNAIVEFSKDGTILNVNRQFADMMGYSVNDLIGKEHTILLTESLHDNNDFVWEKLAAGEPYAGRFKRKNKNGDTIWIQASYSPVIDLNGEITRITNISTDITNDVLAINALEELSNQKDNFIANISHELRSPIHAIIGFTDLLLEQEASHEKQKQLQAVKAAGDSLLYLVNGILDLSKIEAGLFRFEWIDFKLKETLDNVFSILEGKAAAKHLEFRYELAPDIPAWLNGDPNRLTQVLMNLLDNALKFTHQGEVVLRVSAASRTNDNLALTFVVSDTGIGIAEDQLESVFGRFTQAEQNTARKFGGTGLGLNICKLLVEKQGGTIGVTSKPGEKTEFTFTIGFEIPEQQQQVSQPGGSADYSHLQGKILMCEDNIANRTLAQQLFLSTKLELDIAENGKEGIERLREKAYDLVLMDIQMPEMDGYQATEYIRNELKSSIPIIALTAHSIVREREKCLEIGMNDYLSKPFRKNELFDKIQPWLKQENTTTYMEDLQFSLEILREASMGNSTFEKQMMDLFLEQTSEALDNFRNWHKEQNWTAISKQAHQLKSSFGMFMMDTKHLDQLERHTDQSGSTHQIEVVENQIKQAQEHIDQLKKGMN